MTNLLEARPPNRPDMPRAAEVFRRAITDRIPFRWVTADAAYGARAVLNSRT
ncbi:hypothetical protein Sros01_02740 [Streptomyces roseochromogenus]|nr:hypothetical protein Sros01_02740 [Streptomyces roseochromogenus]